MSVISNQIMRQGHNIQGSIGLLRNIPIYLNSNWIYFECVAITYSTEDKFKIKEYWLDVYLLDLVAFDQLLYYFRKMSTTAILIVLLEQEL